MRVLDIDDILKLILQFGNFQDFLCFGQVCKRFQKLRCDDFVTVKLKSEMTRAPSKNDKATAISEINPEYSNWLKSRKWKRGVMQGPHISALNIVAGHLKILHLSRLVHCSRVYTCIPTQLIELSIVNCRLPLILCLDHFSFLTKLSLATSDNIKNVSFPLQLQHLDLSNSDCSNMSNLAHLSNLDTLNLSYCANLSDLDGLTHLKKFSLGGKNKIPVFQLGVFLVHMKHLHILDFSHSYVLNNNHLVTIADYKQLEYLNVSQTQKPLDLSIISHSPQLKELHINGLLYITTNVIHHISYLPKLEKLYMSGCQYVTSVKELNRVKNLQYLDITKCSSITDYLDLPKHVTIHRFLWVPIK
jgi:hypothetical protein